MKSILKKVLKVTVAVAMCFSSLPWLNKQVNYEVQAAQETNYEIYPKPHKMTYSSGEMIVSAEVNVVYDSTIDQETKNHLTNVLKTKNITATVTDAKVEGKTNILVGTFDSKGTVGTYVQSDYGVSANAFTKQGSYYFSTTKDEIVILGKDSDAAFYGITTLKAIFNQINGTTLRHVTIEDYADVKIRGFIEGYYGIPWTNEDRMNLMRFGGDIKMTSYIFAPKDDPYHKQLWRDKYPADELAKLKEMVRVGNETKCRFVWTAHPFMGGFKAHEADQEIERLIAKFEHLYTDAGVRQFGVLGDDVGQLDKNIVIRMMERVGAWAKEKKDVYDVVFCPAGYNDSWQGNYSELNMYDAGFPDNVQIFWTGQAVCKPIEQTTLNNFRNKHKQNNKTRRAPLFWLNWPVNDINHSRMLMGPADHMLQTNINLDDLAGAVTNPMQESEASKVAIFQLADYLWNVRDFNSQVTWADSFKYIEPNAAEEMFTLAKHMANPEPNGHGLVMPESVEIAPKLAALKEKLLNNTASVADIDAIINEFKVIENACDGFEAKSQNKNLKEDLAPYIASMRDLAQSNIKFLEAEKALLNNDKQASLGSFTMAQAELKNSATHTKPTLGAPEIVDPGSTQLIPFAKALENHLSPIMSEYVGVTGPSELVVTASSSFNDFYAGPISNIIDGRDNTHAWYGGTEAKGQYYQVNYSIPQTIYGVHILNGAARDGKQQDTFGTGKVMYQVKGSTEWKQLGGLHSNYPERVDVTTAPIENVVAVRYECHEKGSQNKWPSMREFRVSLQPEETQFDRTVIYTENDWKQTPAEIAKMIDADKNSSCHFIVRQGDKFPQAERDKYKANDYFGVKLSKKIVLGKINIIQGRNDNDGDYFKKAKLQYSVDGKVWKDLTSTVFTGRTVSFDASDLNVEAQYVRLAATEGGATWIAVRDFDVKAKLLFNAKADTNVSGLKLGANLFEESANVETKNNITLKPGEYVGIKLDRIHEITSITSELEHATGIELLAGKNVYELKPYTKGSVDARYVRLTNTSKKDVTFNIKKLALTTREFQPISYLTADSGFSLYDANNNPASNLFDKNWANQVIFNGSQTQGRKFIYDLGQPIDINTFKVVCHDGEHDFPRHAKISVSTDKKNWTDIMFIGDQDKANPGEATDEDDINYVLPVHETSYNTKEVKLDAAKRGRYIKFEITRTKVGSDKWVRFQEFVINGGVYLQSQNNPTFEGVRDTADGQYKFLMDGKLNTAYIPEKDTGSLSYHVSEGHDRNVVKFVQAANVISNATVSARVIENGKSKEITLGKLDKVFNEFVLPANVKLVEVRVNWDKVTPCLYEMILSKKEVQPEPQPEPQPQPCEHKDIEIVGAKKATCTENGNTGKKVCKTCKHVLEEAKVIKATGHRWMGAGKEPTCGEEGRHYAVCQNCYETIDKVLPATGKHTYGEWKVVKEATETEEGLKERICTGCNKKQTEKIAKLPSSSIKPVEPQKPSESKPNKDETGTGDTTTMMTSVVAMAIAAFAVVVLRKRKMN